MFDSVALNVVIGLIFIYLLYSLLATILAEIIATTLGLGAYNLKEAVDRMLNDEPDEKKSWGRRFLDSLNIRKDPQNPMITNFYNHPEIKYLGSTGVFRNPSSFKAVSFSKTLLYSLSGEGAVDKTKIKTQLEKLMSTGTKVIPNPPSGSPPIVPGPEEILRSQLILDHETAKYVLSLWDDSYGDLVKFKLHLEAWFDRTMEQSTEWYKRKIQVILLLLGFCMAWFFCADTFTIISKLSTDKDAREKMVQLASSYVQNRHAPGSIRSPVDDKRNIDSLLEVKKQLAADIANANTILGLGGWLPDSIGIKKDSLKGTFVFTPQVDDGIILSMYKGKLQPDKYFRVCTAEKWSYFFRLFPRHFFGFLVTAIAISLGAPFWFDLLNKLMKLRTSTKQDTDSTESRGNTVSPLKREA